MSFYLLIIDYPEGQITKLAITSLI